MSELPLTSLLVEAADALSSDGAGAADLVVAFRRDGGRDAGRGGSRHKGLAPDAERRHTRAEWLAEVAGLCDRLGPLALMPGARVALYDEDPYGFSVGLFACWQLRAVAVLPPNIQTGTLGRLRDQVVAAIGGDGGWLDGIPGFAPVAEAEPSAGVAVSAERADLAVLAELDREAEALELFTSGTTGEGKASPKLLRHLEDEVRTLEQTFGGQIGDARIYATASHQHLYGLLFRVLWPLAMGRAFCCDRLLHAEELLPRLAREPRSVLASVPAHLARLVEASGLVGLAASRCRVFSSGGPLLRETAHAWERTLGDAPTEVFGSTETGGVAYRQQQAALGERVAWTPFAGVEIEVDPGTTQLRVRSAAVSENEQAGFAMGDRAVLLPGPGSRFELGGRVDRVVKIGEKRLELAEMESRLCAHPAVDRAALVAIEQGGQSRIGAVVVPSHLGGSSLERGRALLGRELADHLALDFDRVLVPRAWRYVSALPEDAQGKVTVPALRTLFDSGSPAQPTDPAARPLEPNWQPAESGEGWCQRRGVVPEDLASFEGHFPGAPIVAGTVQLDWAVELAREQLAAGAGEPVAGDEPALVRVEALKFAAPLGPGDRCVLRVDRRSADEPGRVRFRLFSPAGAGSGDGREFASGRLVFR